MTLGKDSVFTIPVAVTFAGAVKLFDLLKAPPLHPVVTGALLFTLTRAPPQVREPVLATLSKYATPDTISKGIIALKAFFALGLARKLHNYLTVLAQNNFRLRSEAHNYDWPKEIALVTGAAGGIGAAIATDLAAKGLTVIAVDIAPSLSDTLAQKPNVHFHRCDITDRAAVMDLASTIRSQHGDVSILVNNAGLAYSHTTLSATEPNLRKLYDVNVLAHYWTLQAFLPAMLARKKGHIVSTASMASFYPAPGLGPYSSTKVAVLALHEALQQELRVLHSAPEILLTIVHPTFVSTAMTRAVKSELEKKQTIITPEDVSRGICGNVFAGRGGQVVLSGSLGNIPPLLRGLPHWLVFSLVRAAEQAKVEVPEGEVALK